MLSPIYTKQFEKDVHLQKRRGKNIAKLKQGLTLLIEDKKFPFKNRDHKLTGHLKDYRECHIESDWLLIYGIKGTHIYFTRTGTHADLFE